MAGDIKIYWSFISVRKEYSRAKQNSFADKVDFQLEFKQERLEMPHWDYGKDGQFLAEPLCRNLASLQQTLLHL